MKINKLIVILLIITIVLILIDLFSGIWFWNKLHLKFDPANFNNIFTPIFTIVAAIIYAFALFNAISHNKIIKSQNLKPHYEREIEQLIFKAQNTIIEGELIGSESSIKINALNYIQFINDAIIKLSRNKDYPKDYEMFIKNTTMNQEYFKDRIYYGTLLFLSKFYLLNPLSFLYDDIKLLIQEINKSKLLIEEKELLKNRIKRELLNEYMSFISFMDTHSQIIPPIPIIFGPQGNVEFKILSKTNFRKHYDWLKNEFK